MTLRYPVSPMKAAIGNLPPDDENWAYEIKWDGYRTLAFVDGKQTRLQSSNLIDVTAKYPELSEFAGSVNASSAIVDGELVVLDAEGRPSFELMQQHATQVAFYVFDVLSVDGNDTISLAYEQRRELVTGLVEAGPNWMVPAHRVGDGAALVAATVERGLEGVMAKRLGSTYVPGKRTPNWRKVKNRYPVEVVIGGYTPGTGNRTSTFGALLVGVAEDDGLRFAGGVGTGFNQRTLKDLSARLASLRTATSPFKELPPREYSRNAIWVRPELRATVVITEFTNEGYVRHSSFTGLIE
ncbi:MAG: bifunctional non-ous end joining protein LigD [Ilumatobacteraceae bacterium]|jgi:bifunctional non-homologous end joining protein LigD